jgi:hypothetical protein
MGGKLMRLSTALRRSVEVVTRKKGSKSQGPLRYLFIARVTDAFWTSYI